MGDGPSNATTVANKCDKVCMSAYILYKKGFTSF